MFKKVKTSTPTPRSTSKLRYNGTMKTYIIYNILSYMPEIMFWRFVGLFVAIIIVSTIINLYRRQQKNKNKFIKKEKRNQVPEQKSSKFKFWSK